MDDHTGPGGGWSLAALLDDIPKGKKRCIELEGQSLILCRIYGEVYALENYCPHLGKPLADGRLQEYEISCPYHNASFDVRSGKPVAGPSVWPVITYPCKVDAGKVYVKLKPGAQQQTIQQDPRLIARSQ